LTREGYPRFILRFIRSVVLSSTASPVALQKIFKSSHPIIGVVHLLPLPTSPRWGGSLKTVIDRAEQEAAALAAGGVDGLIIENFFDAPFAKDQVDPAVVSALAIATCVGAQFIRVNVLTGVMATDQGLIEGQAHQLLRYRRELGSDVKILADVLVKHARPLGSPNLTTAVQETIERGLADGIILSGWGTGSPPNREDLELAMDAAKGVPLFIGSGASWENIHDLIPAANGVIVASSLKRGGQIDQRIDPIRVSRFVEALHRSVATQANVAQIKASVALRAE
jgi:uncharacterized protein